MHLNRVLINNLNLRAPQNIKKKKNVFMCIIWKLAINFSWFWYVRISKYNTINITKRKIICWVFHPQFLNYSVVYLKFEESLFYQSNRFLNKKYLVKC